MYIKSLGVAHAATEGGEWISIARSRTHVGRSRTHVGRSRSHVGTSNLVKLFQITTTMYNNAATEWLWVWLSIEGPRRSSYKSTVGYDDVAVRQQHSVFIT